MKAMLLLLVMLVWSAPMVRAATQPTVMDLVGRWDAAFAFGKFKFRLIMRVAKTEEGRLAATMDMPDQGAKGIPIPAILFNSPEVRIEVDQFQTAFKGEMSEDLAEIVGEFEEGPGGRPIAVTFKRSTQTEELEPEKVFTFKEGETRDLRGHWKTGIEPMPGMNLTYALNVGRIADGSFRANLDVLEQGAKDIPATSVKASGDEVLLEWEGLQINFKGKLSEDGNRISGDWKQRGKPSPVSFVRLEAPATLIPKDISYEPDLKVADDIRGKWTGRLELPGQKLRLIVKVGKTPDGIFGGTLTSPDQGPGELPMSSGKVEPPKVLLEWKGVRGKFEGTITNNGSVLEGTWEQFGNKMPLKLERDVANATKS